MSRIMSLAAAAPLLLVLALLLPNSAAQFDGEEEMGIPFPPEDPIVEGVMLDGSFRTVDLDPNEAPEPSAAYAEYQKILDKQGQPQHCISTFGTVLGAVEDVPAYSNCNDRHISMVDHVITAKLPSTKQGLTTFTAGMKWQCVEYARRYIALKHGVVFTDVVGAVDIWRLTSVHPPHDVGRRVHLGRFRNFDTSNRQPAPGSMVIWPIQEDMPFGHVAIIQEVILDRDPAEVAREPVRPGVALTPTKVGRVRIGEQNYHSTQWAQPTYARELSLETHDGVFYAITDPDGYRTLGWMTVEDNIRPLEHLVHLDDDPGVPPVATPRNDQPKFVAQAHVSGV